MMIATTNRKYFNELLKCPLFFMQRKCEEHCFYESMRTEISAFLLDDKIVNKIVHLKYVLFVVENEVSNNHKESSDSVTFSFHIATPQYDNDWVIIFNSLINRSQNAEDKFPFIFTLWFLNHSSWSISQLKYAIGQYDIKGQPYILKWLQKICRCLSYQKQKRIKDVAHYFNFEYEIYIPEQITDALRYVTPMISETNYNLFDLIDHILGDTSVRCDNDGNIIYHEVDTNSSNALICLYKWFVSNRPLEDYQLLKLIYSLVSDERQLKIIQRYFHDVRLGNVSFDIKLIEQFKDNDYLEFMRYRYCINTPWCKINIRNQLLCDCILTLIETQGKSFQSFNGVLDFLITHCDATNPKIDLGMERFLPCCNGGAVYNDDFVGFIDYSIIVSLEDKKFTSENLKKTIINLLDSRGRKKRYFTCKYDNNARPLDINSKCLKFSTSLKSGKLDCIVSAVYKDIWVVGSDDSNWFNLFLNKTVENSSNKDIEINLTDTSAEKMKESIYRIASKYKNGDSETYIISSEIMNSNSFECKLLFEYSAPKTMRIYPQKQVFVGSQFDIFKVKESIAENLNNEELLSEFKNKETDELTKRVVASLSTILEDSVYNGVYFETTYNKILLDKLRRLYYYKKSVNAFTKYSELSFLRRKTLNRRSSLFCAPKLSEVHNQAIDVPFFWCRGNECFRNALDKQCLQNNSIWGQYTLFHFAEIIGYPKLHQVECGYEPDGIISLFIVVANKAMKKFSRLKCRACGHLMYPVKRDNFDRNNYYSCINPTCSEYKKAVYLNYCYRCRNELIDSRDTKQCPNGWYICPKCLSCCDDKQYERLAQRYEISHLPIPKRIQLKIGKGHNDKGIFFCPNCGYGIDINVKMKKGYCSKCGEYFEIKIDN